GVHEREQRREAGVRAQLLRLDAELRARVLGGRVEIELAVELQIAAVRVHVALDEELVGLGLEHERAVELDLGPLEVSEPEVDARAGAAQDAQRIEVARRALERERPALLLGPRELARQERREARAEPVGHVGELPVPADEAHALPAAQSLDLALRAAARER